MGKNYLMNLLSRTTRIIKRREIDEQIYQRDRNNLDYYLYDYNYDANSRNYLIEDNQSLETGILENLKKQNTINEIKRKRDEATFIHSQADASSFSPVLRLAATTVENYVLENAETTIYYGSQQDQQQTQQLFYLEADFFLILLFTLVSLFTLAIVASTMVYCCLKRRNSYKSAPNDLATLSLSSTNLTTQNTGSLIGGDALLVNLNNSIGDLSTNFTSSSLASSTNNLIISAVVSSSNGSGGLASSCSTSSANCSSSATAQSCSSAAPNCNHHQPIVCINLPIAKPSLSDSKPQLSIESKMKAKTLFERRGSNNSLTLTINPVIKKKIANY